MVVLSEIFFSVYRDYIFLWAEYLVFSHFLAVFNHLSGTICCTFYERNRPRFYVRHFMCNITSRRQAYKPILSEISWGRLAQSVWTKTKAKTKVMSSGSSPAHAIFAWIHQACITSTVQGILTYPSFPYTTTRRVLGSRLVLLVTI